MNKTDLKYFSFSISNENLRDYIDNTVQERKFLRWHKNNGAYEFNITNSIIKAVAANQIEINPKNTETLNLLEELIKKCGYGQDGEYLDYAHTAMQNLCKIRGQKPDAITLYDHTMSGKLKQGRDKIKSFFGFKSKKQPAPQPKSNKSLVGTAIAGVALLALTTMLTGEKVADNKQPEKEPTKKENMYAMKSNQVAQPIQEKTIENQTSIAKTETSAELQSINNFCDSSLEILMGAEKRDSLYNKIQNQVERGIFKIPAGMSVQRIAHAMEMSRVYEGHSVILDALNAETQLTEQQQEAFASHIDGIGIRGEKLQQRMAEKHKLSSYSRFDNASKSQQVKHIKNLKQLRQMRARTR